MTAEERVRAEVPLYKDYNGDPVVVIAAADRDALLQALADGREREEGLKAALEWFSARHNLSLAYYAPEYCDDDDDAEEWRVHRESGPVNDREWEMVGAGDTALKAILDARQTIEGVVHVATESQSQATALKDRVERLERALKSFKCGSCGGSGAYTNRSRHGATVVQCKVCDGTGQHPTARAALQEPTSAFREEG